MLTFDRTSVLLNGKREFLVSGEFHYFRVPHEDWRRRLRLFREAGGNCVATYVPWLIHEPVEGGIVFGDRPERDLAGFLEAVAEEGLMAICRPGPYQYSELACNGLPEWLCENYPELAAKKLDGSPIHRGSVSYMHPGFLERARRYFRAYADVVRPFMASRGGPVVLTQLDNELTGIHVWFGSFDANPETFGFGREDGRYPSWLRRKYGTPQAMNEAYGTDFASFADARPILSQGDVHGVADERRRHDFALCYYRQAADYLLTLRDWLREDGIDGPLSHNASGSVMSTYFQEACADLAPDFLLGSDLYYTLGQGWGGSNSPTPHYYIDSLFSLDSLRALGMPPAVLEMPGGSPTDMPPILRNDLLACYMANLAAGMKAVNYYVFTGGPNFGETGTTCDIYDYNAAVHADGSLNETYYAMKDFGAFLRAHPELLDMHRVASVQLGFDFDWLRSRGWFSPSKDELDGGHAFDFIQHGLLYTLLCSRYSAEHVDLAGPLDPARPLLVGAAATLSAAAQRNVADFVRSGGRLVITPSVPVLDEDFRPCTILADAICPFRLEARQRPDAPVIAEGRRLYGGKAPRFFAEIPEGATPCATDAATGETIAFERAVGEGRVVVSTLYGNASHYDQCIALESLLDRLGAKPAASSSNRSVFTSLFESPDGSKRALFALNLYSSPQSTDVTLYRDGVPCPPVHFDLQAMEVKYEVRRTKDEG